MAFMAKQRAQTHYNAGTQLLTNPSSQESLQEAIKHLRKATKLDPSFAHAFHNLAHAWYIVAEGFISASSRQDFWINVYKGSGFMKDHTDVEDFIVSTLESALEAVDRALAILYEFPQAHNTRAMILAKLFRLDEAMEATKVALSQYPDYKNSSDNREKIKEMIKERAAIPGYENESSFLENIKELRKTQSKIWKDLMK